MSVGYGVSGSFFVIDLPETLPFQGNNYHQFSKKKFIGNSQNLSIGYRLNKNNTLNIGINYQHFSKAIKSNDILSNVNIYIDNTIHHRDYMYFINWQKSIERKNHLLIGGAGIYYLRSKDQTIEYGIGIPNFFSLRESNFKNSNEEEGGAFAELGYEYKFQQKVNLGIKSQFYFTISTGEPESIALLPYIKICF